MGKNEAGYPKKPAGSWAFDIGFILFICGGCGVIFAFADLLSTYGYFFGGTWKDTEFIEYIAIFGLGLVVPGLLLIIFHVWRKYIKGH